MTVDRLQNKSRQRLLTTFGSLILVSGCASPALHSKCDPACSTAECLPRTQVDAPPAAMIANVDRCVEPIDPEVIQAPNGTYLNHWRELMSRGAQQAHWVIERNEWFDGGEQLGPKGSEHLARIATAFAEDPQWIAIENALPGSPNRTRSRPRAPPGPAPTQGDHSGVSCWNRSRSRY